MSKWEKKKQILYRPWFVCDKCDEAIEIGKDYWIWADEKTKIDLCSMCYRIEMEWERECNAKRSKHKNS